VQVHLLFPWVEASVVSIYVIGDSDLERVDVINDLGVLVDSRMTFVDRIGSKLARMLEFIKRISREFNDPYTYKTYGVCIVRLVASSRGSFGED
jgi:hypothetical protein